MPSTQAGHRAVQHLVALFRRGSAPPPPPPPPSVRAALQLLYIVPSCLGAVALTAASRGELRRIWSFTDRPSFGALEALAQQEASDEQPPGGQQ